MIITRAPVRISFGGGGTDMAAFYMKHGGAVVSTAIDKHLYTIFHPREDNKIQMISSDLQSTLTVDDFYHLKFGEGFDIPAAVIKYFGIRDGFDLFMASEIPAGSGLGSSGAVAVNMVHLCSTLKGKPMSKERMAEDAYFVQRRFLNLPIGKQDEYAACYGGLNFIEFHKTGVIVTPLDPGPRVLEKLESNLCLFFTGKTRNAGDILKHQESAAEKNDKRAVEAMVKVKALAYQIKEVLLAGNLKEFGFLLHEAWEFKKKMSPGISNGFLDEIYDLARKNGALGGKLTGAGGGGFFLFYCEQPNQERLESALRQTELKRLDFRFQRVGARTLDIAYER